MYVKFPLQYNMNNEHDVTFDVTTELTLQAPRYKVKVKKKEISLDYLSPFSPLLCYYSSSHEQSRGKGESYKQRES